MYFAKIFLCSDRVGQVIVMMKLVPWSFAIWMSPPHHQCFICFIKAQIVLWKCYPAIKEDTCLIIVQKGQRLRSQWMPFPYMAVIISVLVLTFHIW